MYVSLPVGRPAVSEASRESEVQENERVLSESVSIHLVTLYFIHRDRLTFRLRSTLGFVAPLLLDLRKATLQILSSLDVSFGASPSL